MTWKEKHSAEANQKINKLSYTFYLLCFYCKSEVDTSSIIQWLTKVTKSCSMELGRLVKVYSDFFLCFVYLLASPWIKMWELAQIRQTATENPRSGRQTRTEVLFPSCHRPAPGASVRVSVDAHHHCFSQALKRVVVMQVSTLCKHSVMFPSKTHSTYITVCTWRI